MTRLRRHAKLSIKLARFSLIMAAQRGWETATDFHRPLPSQEKNKMKHRRTSGLARIQLCHGNL